MKRSVNSYISSMISRLGFAAVAAALFALPAHGAPQGGQVVAGNASISQSGNNTTITAGNDAIINYSHFNIGSNESVRFVQPSSSSRVLNRVTTNDPSRIAGSLSANGIVYLVNPAGIYFAQGARINVAGLYAAGGQMTNSDFTQHIDLFKGLTGSVVNNGHIQAGTANLLGRYVANRGQIDVANGTLTLLAGHNVYMRNIGGHIMVKLDGKTLGDQPVAGTNGVQASLTANPGVENTGSINAGGSQVTLGAGDMYSLAVRNSGQIQAGAGTVKVAANDGAVENTGTINASGATAGSVSLVGPDVVNSGSLDASSTAGDGGSVTVLGNHNTYLTDGSSIAASGVNGGHVLINTTNGTTYFMHGASIVASGTHAGGMAEVSGMNLAFDGAVNLAGETINGQLLLDPYNLDIVSGTGTDHDTLPGGVINFNDPSTVVNSNTTVSSAALESASSSTAIVLEAKNNLTVDAPLILDTAHDLQLSAYNNLTINQSISNAANVTLQANADSSGAGNLVINAPITGVVGGLFGTGYEIKINTSQISSNGDQQWTGLGVLQSDTTLTAPIVSFVGDSLNGAHSLNIAGTVEFGGAVGTSTPLASLTVANHTTVAGGAVTTSGDQNYNGGVTLSHDTTFTGNNLNFNSTIDGAHALIASATNNILFAGPIGATTPLSSMTLRYGGQAKFTTTNVHVTGNVNSSLVSARSSLVVLGSQSMPTVSGTSGQTTATPNQSTSTNNQPLTTDELSSILGINQNGASISTISASSNDTLSGAISSNINQAAAESAIQQYQALFTVKATGSNNQTVTTDNAPVIRQAIGSAWSSYSSQTNNPTAGGFVASLSSSGSGQRALGYLKQLKQLFTTLDYTGLDTTTLNSLKSRIVSSVTPDKMNQDQMSAAIQSVGNTQSK